VLARQERSHEGAAFNTALHGPLGASGIDAAEIILAKDTGPGGGGAPPPVSPFPVSLPDPLHDKDKELNDAFAHAKAQVTSIDIPLIIVACNTGGDRPYVAQKPFEMHYSASLLKVAAMYAAYQLRATVNGFAANLDLTKITTEKALFQAIGRAFDNDIRTSVPLIHARLGGNDAAKLPNYEAVFEATMGASQWELDFSGKVDFSNQAFFNKKGDLRAMSGQSFRMELDAMIEHSDDYSSSYCIRRLGYSYINGLLAKAGFFGAKGGIWLAGDYTASWPEVRIRSVNDADAMQVTNVYQMARLVSLLEDDDLVQFPGASGVGTGGKTMKDLMTGAVTGRSRSVLGTAQAATSGFTVERCKIGIGPLKGGQCHTIPSKGCVASEASVLKHSSGRRFVTVWQNLKDSSALDVLRLARLIELTMDEYDRRLKASGRTP
jgi:hypothetical protein